MDEPDPHAMSRDALIQEVAFLRRLLDSLCPAPRPDTASEAAAENASAASNPEAKAGEPNLVRYLEGLARLTVRHQLRLQESPRGTLLVPADETSGGYYLVREGSDLILRSYPAGELPDGIVGPDMSPPARAARARAWHADAAAALIEEWDSLRSRQKPRV